MIPYSAQELSDMLGGRRCGSQFMARCPAHDDRTPSLSIKDGHTQNIVLHCFGGCPQQAVIEALRDRGLWPSRDRESPPLRRSVAADANRRRRESDEYERYRDVASRAEKIWKTARQCPSDHNYVIARGLSAERYRVDDLGRLIVPFFDVDGRISTLQFIDSNGSKMFLAGGKKRGSFGIL